MRFWIRELAGWGLVSIGLYFFYVCLALLIPPAPTRPRGFEAIPVMIIGIIIFRGGIHLLKVAVAARICTRLPPLPEEDNNVKVALPPSQQVTRLPR